MRLGRVAVAAGALLLGSSLAACPPEPTPRACKTLSDCCADSPSSLCGADGYCAANAYCAADSNCNVTRWGACLTGGTANPSWVPTTRRAGDCVRADSKPWAGLQRCRPIGELEQAAANRLQALWSLVPRSVCAFDSLYDEVYGGCGPINPMNAQYCNLDGEISWDTEFMASELGAFGTFADVVILAHEWGHLNQHALGFIGEYVNGHYTKPRELHADCQAGIFVAVEESVGNLQPGDLSEAFATLCAGGQPTGWFDPNSHGSCEERVASFTNGYDGAKARLGDVCSAQALETMLAICGRM